MNEDPLTNTEITHLPKEFVDRLKKPFIRFLHIEAAGGVVLLLFTIAALILSNSPWAHVYEHAWETPVGLQFGSLEYVRSLRDWINTMALFIANLALSKTLLDSAKLGIFLATVFSAVAGLAVLMRLPKQAKPPQ